jgi:hypothetical protein
LDHGQEKSSLALRCEVKFEQAVMDSVLEHAVMDSVLKEGNLTSSQSCRFIFRLSAEVKREWCYQSIAILGKLIRNGNL